jgi:signal peptidase I
VSGRFVALLLLAALALLAAQTGTLVEVRSDGMAPALLEGDWVHVVTVGRTSRAPRRGSVVAFRLAVQGERRQPPDRLPGAPTQATLGRVVGLPGDEVEVRRQLLRLDGDRVRRDRVTSDYRDPTGRRLEFHRLWLGRRDFVVARDPVEREPELGPTRVEPGRYLILGDHRNRAYDSRFWGTLGGGDLIGAATVVVFSRDPRTGGIRWSRIGRVVE